jgi:hydroxyacylglutathione hydrolase
VSLETSSSDMLVPIDLGLTRAFLLRGHRPILVDAGRPGDHQEIVKALLRLGIEPANLGMILLSHGHHDHFGGAAALKRMAANATLAIGRRDGTLVQMTQPPHYHPSSRFWRVITRFVGNRLPTGLEAVEPSWYIGGEVDLKPYGVPGRIIPTPGHTAGSLSIVLTDGTVFIADLFMGMLPARLPRTPIYVEDMAAWQHSVRQVMALRPRILLASHGGPFDPAHVARRFPWALS